ncbi:MAG: glycosyltransferase [Bacteroidetes bacterium]|nr:MAG: glycosyltransferase [Bacteroidota bacterium]
MKIAINTRLLLKDKLEGIGSFEFETLSRITRQHPEHDFYFIFDRKYHPDFIFNSNVTPVILPPQARHPILYYLWFQHTIRIFLKRLKPDLFISPDGYLPLRTRTTCLSVFHDLNWEHFPKDLPTIDTWFYKKNFPRFAKKADRLCTVSAYSKRDIVNLYNVNPDKIDVVYSGINTARKPASAAAIANIRKQFTGQTPYFIFVGSLHPRKNLHNLFRAYDIFRDREQQEARLVIVGQKKWWTKEIASAFKEMTHPEEIIFTGRVSDETLNALIGGAEALTYVSKFEGFGLPILEAFHSGIPLITSNVSSIPEIAGDAALFADPSSPDAIADQMQAIFMNKTLRETLIEKGYQRKQLFSWQRTADLLWSSIEKTIPKRP